MNRRLTLALAAAFTSMAVVFIVRTFADAVFLANFGVDYLPHFYVAQSASLIGLSFLYTWLIRRGALVIDVAILAVLAACALAAPWLADVATFAVALALITLSTLAQMAVWNAATSVVSGRKSRTFLPRAGAAATAGAVAGGFASTGIVSVAGVSTLAWVSAVLTLGTLVARFALRTVTSEYRPSSTLPPPRGSSGAHLARSSRPAPSGDRGPTRDLVWLLAAAVMVEGLLSQFIDFGFKASVTDAFESRYAIGMFFSIYYGITNVVLLVTQLAAASRLLATRSLRSTLMLSPVVLGVASVAWAALPLLAIAALTRGLENVMKFAVSRPAQEVAMTPIPELARKQLKVIVRGVFSPGGAAIAGGLLLVARPLLDRSEAVVPIVCVAFALALVIIARFVAIHYLAALGSDLGLRQMARAVPAPDAVLDRDTLGRFLEMAGSDDPAVADTARDMLGQLPSSAALAPHVGTGNAAKRRALYGVLAERPSSACTAKLVIAVAREPTAPADGEVGALGPGLLALAAHGDRSQVERASALVTRQIAETGAMAVSSSAVIPAVDSSDELQRAAWAYLSLVGALDDDPEHHREVLVGVLGADGATAAFACASAIARGAIAGSTVDDAIVELAESCAPGGTSPRAATSSEHRLQALIAAAILDRDRGIELVIRELATGSRWAEELAAAMQASGLARVRERLFDHEAPLRDRQRLLAALRTSPLHELVTELAVGVLAAPPALALRDQAVRLLLPHHAEGDVPRAPVERALDEEMDRFAIYVLARPGYGSAARESQMEVRYRGGPVPELTAEAFFYDELERCTERSLGRICALLALLGKPEAVFDAERGLRAPTFQRRRQALDVLQEVLRGKQKTRLLELLDRYLIPPRANPPGGARDAAIAIDPWLARCANEARDATTRRLWALRSAVLFDAVDGESLAALAQHADEVVLAPKQIVVHEGEPGDALYIVIEGALGVERAATTVAQLGPGEAFGELALLDGEPRRATVRAHSASRLLRLPRDTFDRALDTHPEIGLGLVLGLVKWLRQDSQVRTSQAVRQSMM